MVWIPYVRCSHKSKLRIILHHSNHIFANASHNLLQTEPASTCPHMGYSFAAAFPGHVLHTNWLWLLFKGRMSWGKAAAFKNNQDHPVYTTKCLHIHIGCDQLSLLFNICFPTSDEFVITDKEVGNEKGNCQIISKIYGTLPQLLLPI